MSAAHIMLVERGLQPIDIKEHKSVLKFEITKKTVSRKDIMHFSRQLSVFIEAGIPIMEALGGDLRRDNGQAPEEGPRRHGRGTPVG